MKTYKLLKDSTTKEAGAIFSDAGECLTNYDGPRPVVLYKDSIINFSSWFEEVPETVTITVPKGTFAWALGEMMKGEIVCMDGGYTYRICGGNKMQYKNLISKEWSDAVGNIEYFMKNSWQRY